MKITKILWIILGFIGLALGVVGAIMPFLPAFPFLMLAAVSFAKSSDRLDQWFRSTNLYKKNLESYVSGQGMTKNTKVRVIAVVSFFFSFAAYMMRRVPVGLAVLGAVWLFHVYYFMKLVKNKEEEK